jgi:hypothetical protein
MEARGTCAQPERCNLLWLGPALGRVERACIRSMLRQGHAVALYCYEEPEGVPAGAEVRDAATILPLSAVVRHRSGSVALFADRFRYTLMQQNAGLWLDCDMYLLAPVPGADGYVMGLEEPGTIGAAILRIPSDSPLLRPLLALFEEKDVPPWLPARSRAAAHLRRLITGRNGLARMPWGTAGPHALSSLARTHGVYELAAPPEVFYPVHWRDAAWVLDPEARLEAKTGAATVAIHLWNELIKHDKEKPAPRGSFLARLQEEGS